MIIPGNALLALLSPPQECQGTREEAGCFGVLLTEIEQHVAALPDQEDPEHGALACVLQVLMSLFQACTPVNALPMVSTAEAGEPGVGSMRPVAGLALGLSPERGTTPALWGTEGGHPLADIVADGTQDMAQPAIPATPSPSPPPHPNPGATVPAQGNQALGATAEAQFVSPGLQQTSRASGDARPAAAGLQPPGVSQSSEVIPTASRAELAVTANTRPLAAGEEVFQHQNTSQTSHPSPVGAVPAAPWMGEAAAPPVAEEPVLLPGRLQAQAAPTSDVRAPLSLVQAGTAFPEYDASATSHARPARQEWGAETLSSVAPLTVDSALPWASTRATAHLSSVAPASAVPSHHALEDLGRPWPGPLPANTVVLHLEPRELGVLLLRVRVNDKRLIASFQAQSPEAETLLRSHLPSLHELLSQHGFEVQPITISRAAEGFSAHMGAGTGTFAHQHSAFQAFAEDRQAAQTGETQSEVEVHRTPHWPSEQSPRLLDVVI
jgi:chemotaxis protein MotD